MDGEPRMTSPERCRVLCAAADVPLRDLIAGVHVSACLLRRRCKRLAAHTLADSCGILSERYSRKGGCVKSAGRGVDLADEASRPADKANSGHGSMARRRNRSAQARGCPAIVAAAAAARRVIGQRMRRVLFVVVLPLGWRCFGGATNSTARCHLLLPPACCHRSRASAAGLHTVVWGSSLSSVSGLLCHDGFLNRRADNNAPRAHSSPDESSYFTSRAVRCRLEAAQARRTERVRTWRRSLLRRR